MNNICLVTAHMNARLLLTASVDLLLLRQEIFLAKEAKTSPKHSLLTLTSPQQSLADKQ